MFRIIVTVLSLGFVFLGLASARQDTTVISYDNGAEDGIAFQTTGEAGVRFTPNIYPAKVIAIRVFWSNGGHTHLNDVQYSVWKDSAGTNTGPKRQVLENTAHTVASRPGFEDIDISSHNIVINSGDFYLVLIQPQAVPYGLGLDLNGNQYVKSVD